MYKCTKGLVKANVCSIVKTCYIFIWTDTLCYSLNIHAELNQNIAKSSSLSLDFNLLC